MPIELVTNCVLFFLSKSHPRVHTHTSFAEKKSFVNRFMHEFFGTILGRPYNNKKRLVNAKMRCCLFSYKNIFWFRLSYLSNEEEKKAKHKFIRGSIETPNVQQQKSKTKTMMTKIERKNVHIVSAQHRNIVGPVRNSGVAMANCSNGFFVLGVSVSSVPLVCSVSQKTYVNSSYVVIWNQSCGPSSIPALYACDVIACRESQHSQLESIPQIRQK